MPRLARVEIWTDLALASGTRLAMIPELVEVQETEKLEGDDELLVTLRRDSDAWASVREHRVVRVVYDDDSYKEWRIGKTDQVRQNGLTASLPCLPVLQDLGRGMVERTEADGTVSSEFELLGIAPSTLISTILAAAPSYFALGTVDPTAVQDLQCSFDTPLAALRALAALTTCELTVHRDDGAGKYKVDLVTAIGAAAAVAQVRTGKNLSTIHRQTTTDQQATRIYGKGGGEDGFRLTLAQNYWKITGISGTDITLADPAGGAAPVAFNDQLNGLYLRKEGAGSGTLISATVFATQKVTVASAAGLSVNDLVRLTRNSAGDDLTYLDMPSDKALYGNVVGVLERSDIPPVRNLVANPQLNGTYSATLPASWTKVGAPTTSEETTGIFTRRGGKSCKVVATADGQGIECAAIVLLPTATKPYFSGFATIQIASGRVRVEIIDVTNGRSYPDGRTGKAWSNQTSVWVDVGAEGLDLNAVACASAKVRIVADGGAATFYVDSAQLTQAAAQDAFFAGNGAVALWQAVNVELGLRSAPTVTVDVELVDLNRLDGTTFPYDAIVLGGTVRCYDEDMGVDVSTRIVQVVRDLRISGITKLQLSNRPDYLTDALVRPRPQPRFPTTADAPILLDVTARFDDIPNQPAKALVTLTPTIPGASVFYILQNQGDTVPVLGVVGGAGEWAAYGATFLIDRTTGARQLSAYAQLGARYSPIRTFVIDKDTIPSATVGVTENPGGTAIVTTAPDDDVAFYLLYRGKNLGGSGWPTLDNSTSGVLDQAKYIGKIWTTADGGATGRDGLPLAGMGGGTGVGGLVWTESGYVNTDVIKVIVVPVDRNGNAGARATASRTMSGAAAARISAFSISGSTGGSSCAAQATISLAYTTIGATQPNNDLRISRSLNSNPWEVVTTIDDPTAGSPYTDTTPGCWAQVGSHGGVDTTLRYKAELLDSGGNVIDSKDVSTTFQAIVCLV